MSEVSVRNRQRTIRVRTDLLEQFAELIARDWLQRSDFELGIFLVSARRMAEINWRFLSHSGPTDVITFDYSEPNGSLQGEIFICIDVALEQARDFRTTWQEETARYLIHGLLHLGGYDDLEPAARRSMKKKENELLRRLGKRFQLERIGKTTR